MVISKKNISKPSKNGEKLVNNVKIAVCLAGHIRKFNLKNILDQLDDNYDIFISTWDTTGCMINNILNEYTKDLIEYDFSKLKNLKSLEIEKDVILDELENLAIEYDDILEPDVPLSTDSERKRKYAGLSMARKCYRSIMNVGQEYDIIIRTRPDTTWDINLVSSTFDSCIDDDILYIPNNFSFGTEGTPGGGRINADFAVGNYKNIKIYSEIYNWLKTEETKLFLKEHNIWFCFHSLFRQYLIKNNIRYKLVELGYNLHR